MSEQWLLLERRMLVLRWILFAAVACQLLTTPALWFTSRGFPTIPVIGVLPDLPQALTCALSGLFLSALLMAALCPGLRLASYLVLGLAAILVLFDISRLQPWFYQYLLVFLATSIDRADDARKTRAAWAACAFILAATYFWSGLQKANASFADLVFPWLLGPFGEQASPFWFVAPVLETAIGVLLVIPRTRILGVIGALMLHGFILVALGPIGHVANTAVWPWNFWMMVIAVVLFWRTGEPLLRQAWSSFAGKAVVLLTGIMPLFSFAGWWDTYLSASLYSGRAHEAWILLTEKGVDRLPPEAKPFVDEAESGNRHLDVGRCAISELNVPPYPEVRVYVGLARKLSKAGVPGAEMTLEVSDLPTLTGVDTPIRVISLD